jgi:hypothetical protein
VLVVPPVLVPPVLVPPVLAPPELPASSIGWGRGFLSSEPQAIARARVAEVSASRVVSFI